MPTLSLCLITRNEGSKLTHCLESVHDLVDEILVVDTGSTDRTLEIARSFEAKVAEVPWEDSFSVPRNRALAEATGDWIFMLDADERLAPESRPILRELIAGTSEDGINVCIKDVPGGDALFEARRNWFVRLFRRVPGIYFEGRVHEQIVPSIRRAGGAILQRSGIVIHHYGCAEPGPRRQERQQRDLRLLLMEVAERPKDAFARYHLGVTCQSMNKIREATDHLLQALDLSTGQAALSLDLQSKAHTRLAQLYLAQNELETAIRHCECAVGCGSDDPLTFFLAAVVHMHTYDFGTAATVLEHGLEVAGTDDEVTLESGIRMDQLRLALAHCKRLDGHLEKAIPQYRTCTENDPENLDAWIGLAECEAQRQNFSQAKGAFRRALELDPESETAQQGLALCGCGSDG
jgi:tetratricopeptide (TPR) repeat protein